MINLCFLNDWRTYYLIEGYNWEVDSGLEDYYSKDNIADITNENYYLGDKEKFKSYFVNVEDLLYCLHKAIDNKWLRDFTVEDLFLSSTIEDEDGNSIPLYYHLDSFL